MLRKPKIAEFLAKERRTRFRRLHIEGDEVLARVSMDASARVADLLDAHGNVLSPGEWPESVHYSVAPACRPLWTPAHRLVRWLPPESTFNLW